MSSIGKIVLLSCLMNKVSKKGLLAPLVFIASVLIGCMADEVGGIYLISGETDEMYSLPKQTVTVYFHAGGKWTASPSVDWLEVAPSSGEGGRNAIAITTTKPNITMQERIGSVVITSDGKSETVNIRQRGEYAFFDPKEYVVDSAGGVVNMTFTSNIEKSKLLISYFLLIDWIVIPDHKNETRGEIWNGTVKPITVLPNLTSEERSTFFILGVYDDKKKFLGLDTAWIRQKPSSGIVEVKDTMIP